ncbi:MAG: NUDIX domain-containing protein [Clostridia bacterium]|nr:NUDIX domain-containing protein [Clostridia bacterium]
MQYEISCGAVVFTRKEKEVYYVIVEEQEGYYGFPKGHMEGTETEEETALREIYEEVGIRAHLLQGFKTIDEHAIPNKKDVIKKIIYFAAEYDNQEIIYQKEELRSARLLCYEEAMSAFQFESSKRILREAKEFIDSIS